ncbi:helix-turn-helix domain-containing protein [Turicibacter sanguinis]|uniref:helix-turn-helix domain-containing protein n=1 Tax=Turicibacter sanguinis TaxID=154288 RepID=UPI00241DE719|nr:helix-turn-helix transcriptional regulator [Turicibacter sanguinis]
MKICEYLKKNEMTITALALKIGISDSSLRNLIRGGSVSTHIIEKVQKLGLTVDGVEMVENVDNLPTILEVMERDGLTQYAFAIKYGISHTNINYMLRKGYRGASHELAEHLRKQGVYVPVRTYLVPPQGNGERFYGEPKAKVVKEPKSFLKPFQIQSVRSLGNTVVRKKGEKKDIRTPDMIINEFAKYGLTVNVRDLRSDHNGDDCYVVECEF